MRLLGAIILVAAAGIVVSLVMSCCSHRNRLARNPLVTDGVPTIRVRLNSVKGDSVAVSSTAPCSISVDGQKVLRSDGPLKRMRIQLQDGAWRFAGRSAWGRELVVIPDIGSRVSVGDVEYRGSLHFISAAGGRMIAVNHVNMESYLAGVPAKELYHHWSLETYRSLVVAARTFAIYQVGRFGPSHDYDLTDDQGSQVYGGVGAETDKSWKAVRTTHGQVLVYGPVGAERVFLAQYSACCGGTVNGAAVLRNAPDIPPLRGGQRCEDCRPCPRFSWPPVRVSKADLYRCLVEMDKNVQALGSLVEIRVKTFTSYGRPLWVDVVGPKGRTVRLLYDNLRTALIRGGSRAGGKLYSMNCRFRDLGDRIEFYDGHGFGHGVGLCQWGAQGKAQKGWSAERILHFYYPGAKIIKAY